MLAALGLAVITLFAPLDASTAPPASATTAPLDVAPLLEGVSSIAAPGVPGVVVPMHEPAEAVIVGAADHRQSAPVVVASTWGQGRIVALGHTGYLDPATLDQANTGRFLLNAIAWSGAARTAPGTPARGLKTYDPSGALTHWLNAHAQSTVSTARPDLLNLAGVDVLLLRDSDLDAREQESIARFVQSGGGLIIAQTGWGWQQIHAGADMRIHAPSQLLAHAGVAWSDQTVEPTDIKGDVRSFRAAPAPSPLHRFDRALSALFPPAADSPPPPPQAGATVMLGVRLLPANDTRFRPRLNQLLADRAADLAPTDARPLKSDEPALRVLLALQLDALRDLPPQGVRTHASAADFPGPVPPSAPRITATRTIDLATPGWHSLGLYAPPGEVITLDVTAGSLAPAPIHIQIGAHTDDLWHLAAWRRVPDIISRSRLTTHTTRTASPFGGLIYLDVGKAAQGTLTVRISGAVESPLYVAGQTTPEQWRRAREAPAPWGEIATSKVILTVPAQHLRTLDDPAPLCAFWDQVLDAAADFVSKPHVRARPERFVADVQISAGYMHSGYPIMTHLDAAPEMVSLDALRRGTWGLYHELGHNHQDAQWTFEGTGEVTNNVIVLYILETLCQRQVATGHDAIDNPAKRRERLARYLQDGAKFDDWKGDPFLALDMYIQVRQAFGWEPLKQAIAAYASLPAKDRPRTDADKRDRWLMLLSRATKHNLGPFFERWGVPTTEAARRAVADLPAWMPDELKP